MTVWFRYGFEENMFHHTFGLGKILLINALKYLYRSKSIDLYTDVKKKCFIITFGSVD